MVEQQLSSEDGLSLSGVQELPAALLRELWIAADADRLGWTEDSLGQVLWRIAQKYTPGAAADSPVVATFLRGLQLPDLALAQACALGNELAWRIFMEQYRARLSQAAAAIAGSVGQGEELAGSLYAELYGLTEREGVRRSPMASYAGRGSLMGWLRTTLAQRHVDAFRRTHREAPMEEVPEMVAAPVEISPEPVMLTRLSRAVAVTLRAQPPEDAFVISAYFLDGRTLQQLAAVLRVHEATVSRRLKRLTGELHRKLLQQLEADGLSRRAAQEALGTDPRDLSLNLRTLLQTSPGEAFSVQAERMDQGPQ